VLDGANDGTTQGGTTYEAEEVGVPRRFDTAGAGAVAEVGLQEHVGTAKVARIKEKTAPVQLPGG